MGAISTTKKLGEIENLRKRILITIGLIAVYIFGTKVVIPGIDTIYLTELLAQQTGSGLMTFLDMFSGGAFSNASIFALGILPYLYACIIIRLLTIIIPAFRKMKHESGQRKIIMMTRYLTIAILVLQGFAYLTNIQIQMAHAGTSFPSGLWFKVLSVAIMAAGSIIILWIGERITDKGIGNGIAFIVIIGILSHIASLLTNDFLSGINEQAGRFVMVLIEMSLLLLVIAIAIILVLGFEYFKRNVIKHKIQ